MKTVAPVADLVRLLAKLQLTLLGIRQSVSSLRAGQPNVRPIHQAVHETSDPSLVAGPDTFIRADGFAADLPASALGYRQAAWGVSASGGTTWDAKTLSLQRNRVVLGGLETA